MANNKDMVTKEVLEKATQDILQAVVEHVYEYTPYTNEEIAEIFDLDEVTSKSLSKVINDEYVAKNKVFSNEHTMELLSKTLAEANQYTTEQIANSGKLERKIVTSTSEVIDENILYLILTDSTNNIYTQYMLIDGNATPLGTTQINLSDYLKTIDFNTKIDEYAKKNTVVLQNDIVGDLTTLSSNQVLSTQGVSDELDKKVDKTSIVTSIDSSSTDSELPTAKSIWEKTKNMCTTNVPDVPKTEITFTDETYFKNADSNNNYSSYYVQNGICYMSVYVRCVSPKSSGISYCTSDVPKPKHSIRKLITPWDITGTQNISVFLSLDSHTKSLGFMGGQVGADYLLQFSYPVLES